MIIGLADLGVSGAMDAVHINVGPGLMPDFITKINLQCVLAWPAMDEMMTFQRVRGELLAHHIRTWPLSGFDLESMGAKWPHNQLEEAFALAKSKKRPATGHFEKRLRQRDAAARMALGLAHEELFAKPVELPPSMTQVSIDQLSALVLSDTTIADPEELEKTVWRRSLPIIHLAMAVQLLLHSKNHLRDDIGNVVQTEHFYGTAVRLAAAFAPVVARHPKFNIDEASQTRVDWYG